MLSTAAVALFALSAPAMATPISQTVSLNTVFTGATPVGPSPWLTATFTSSTGSTTGTLTLTSGLTSPNFLQGLNSSQATVGWAFYLNQALASITCNGGVCANGNSGYNAGGFNAQTHTGFFNLGFGWGPHGTFDAGNSATYTLTFSSALTGDPFAKNDKGFFAVAHVQGITVGGSGWIVDGEVPPPVTVPEPSSLAVLGFGTLLLGAFIGLRRRWS